MTVKEKHKNVVVLGASCNPDRYSYMAVQNLKEEGYTPVPVHPRGNPVDGIPTYRSLDELKENVDTVTLYVNKRISSEQADSILALEPRRVIFNPGAENDDLKRKCEESGILALEACTLVLLRTGQF